MAVLAWVIMGLAIWHFTIFLPDRFWGGIVGAFLGALAGAALFGFAVSGFDVPSREATGIVDALLAIPGSILGIAAVYAIGASRERRAAQAA